MRLEQAEYLAAEVCDLLRDFTQRIEVAGGIRRGKTEPHDIEIVCAPRFRTPTELTALGTEIPKEPENLLDGRISHMISKGELAKGDPDKAGKRAPSGPRYYRLRYKGEKLDIFAVLPPAQWGTVFAIRTGDADYSHWAVQQGWRLKPQIFVEDGRVIMRGAFPSGQDTIDTPEEADFFKALEIPFVEPRLRNYEATRATRTAAPEIPEAS